MRYLLDTNMVIFLLRGRKEIADAIDRVGFENCAISEITKAELLVGHYKASMKGKYPKSILLDFLDAITIVPISRAVDLFSRELARLQMSGEVIDDFDLLIGTTAVAYGMILVTDNASHLRRIEGVVIENWVDRSNSL